MLGALIDPVVALLPKSDLVQEKSVAGVLLSEVTHFMDLVSQQKLLVNVFRWLRPGGQLALTAVSVHMVTAVLNLSTDRKDDDTADKAKTGQLPAMTISDHAIEEPSYLVVSPDSQHYKQHDKLATNPSYTVLSVSIRKISSMRIRSMSVRTKAAWNNWKPRKSEMHLSRPSTKRSWV
jgi:hypothetical protein